MPVQKASHRCGRTLVALIGLSLLAVGSANATDRVAEVEHRAVEELRSSLAGQQRWIKVHAAEALLETGYPQGVGEAFLQELLVHGDEPEYRIGIWRVLARVAADEADRKNWIDSIRDAFINASGPDRVHAAEALAKLGYVVPQPEQVMLRDSLAANDEGLALFSAWALIEAGDNQLQDFVAEQLAASDSITRLRAAVILQRIPDLSAQNRSRLYLAAHDEHPDSPAHAALLAASFVRGVQYGESADATTREQLLDVLKQGDGTAKRFALSAFLDRGGAEDLPAVIAMLEDDDPDVRVSAAAAALRIARRSTRRLGAIDWAVVAAYAASMIAVGWMCSRRAATTDDYLLGGRSMRPWAVGLSLFATLLSTITYLAIPGEMIRHGPMIVSQVLAFPLVMLAVGWLLIPKFMQSEATSAYELLEKRLGVEVRIVGAVMFLLMRLFWMAVIVYATTDKVLIPLLGWSPSATPYACAAMGAITVIYTSMGGIRAVVITDVLQTLVLLLGAVASMALITYQLSGVENWWPKEWIATWDPPRFWLDPGARVTVSAVLISAFFWHVCTAGSDQMSVQRYLATRDASAARRMFATSLGVNAVVLIFLALLGLALMAFFQHHPNLLGDGQSIQTTADELLPRFIVIGLPPGVRGLVIAALMAAAMSSLSSGINSSCSIVSADFIDRFWRSPASEVVHLRRTSRISWLIGTVVVLLSSATDFVPGNLLEVTFRVVNLFTAPLFVLFLMALFVPWASVHATIAASLLSAATAVGVAFFELGGLSFLWVVPASLLVGVVAGMLLSLVLRDRDATLAKPALSGAARTPKD